MKPQRVGLIGFGLAGRVFHGPLVSVTPGLELVAIVTRDPERRAAATRLHPNARLVDTVDDLMRIANELDLIVVASPNGKHVEHAARAIDAGLSVVVDKPFAGTVAQANALIDDARRRGVIIAPFHNRRWDGDFLTLRGLLDAGRLGNVVRFESRFDRWRVIPKPRWLEPNARANDEGILYDLHTHLVDQALLLFGPVTHVYAETRNCREGVQVEDDAFVALTHASGVRSHLTATIVAAEAGPRFRVHGDRGAFVKFGVDPQEEMLKSGRLPGQPGYGEDSPDFYGRLSDGAVSTSIPTTRGVYEQFYLSMCISLTTGSAPPVDPADAVAGLEIIEASYRSAAEGKVVTLGEPSPARPVQNSRI